MIFYIAILLSNIIIINISNHTKRYGNILKIIPFIILILVVGLRSGVGQDYDAYTIIYNGYNVWEYTRLELSIKLIVTIGNLLHLESSFMFLIYAAITYLFIYLALLKYKLSGKLWIISIILIHNIVLFNSFNTIRQTAAAAIIFYGMTFLFERKFLKYLLIVLLASFFHTTALFAILFIIIIKVDVYYLVPFYIVSPILANYDIANHLIKLAIRVLSLKNYEVYLDFYNTPVEISTGLGLTLYFLIGIIFIIFNRIITENNGTEGYIIKVYLFYIMSTFLFISSNIASRFLYYPQTILIIALPLLPKMFRLKNDRRIVYYVVSIVFIVLYIHYLNGYGDALYGGNILDYR